MIITDACNNYTCPPEHSVPSGDVIVKTVTDTLAVTGGGDLCGLVTLAVFLAVGSGALFAYNELRKRDQKNPFEIGDRVYCKKPRNESWDRAYTATVTGVRGNLIDIKWDHGPSNSGHRASDFAIRS